MAHCSPAPHCPSPAFIAPPMILMASHLYGSGGADRPEYSTILTRGKITARFKGYTIEAPDSGLAGWLSEKLGMFKSQTEPYSVQDFLRRS